MRERHQRFEEKRRFTGSFLDGEGLRKAERDGTSKWAFGCLAEDKRIRRTEPLEEEARGRSQGNKGSIRIRKARGWHDGPGTSATSTV